MDPEPISMYDGQKFIPMVLCECAVCHHKTALAEPIENYKRSYLYMRALLTKAGVENTRLKKQVEYMTKELEQFRKAAV